ncbi:MAG: hydrogenase maturation protease [Candidatus Thermoplasmatota archaeon]|jgi:hydrogenase 3 maturation protease|nr:hydrogenase maturation protease [Candidatus Thermoplasmatota archaeon]
MNGGDLPLTIVVGTGSRLRGDDSAGPYVIDLLKERMDLDGCPEKVMLSLIDADVMPENYTKPIRESGAEVCLIIDAVDMGMTAGAVRRIPEELIDVSIPCSHSLPLSYVMGYLREKVRVVELIGIQISVAGLFHDMSDEVMEGCRKLTDTIWEGNVLEVPIFQRKKDDVGSETTDHCW